MALFGDLVSNVTGIFTEQINLNGYVFDAYLRMQNNSRLQITTHPVESGSPITDNAYTEPKTFIYDIGMTDTSLGKVYGQFGVLNRSVNAYQLIEQWQNERTLITLNNKYGLYRNVLVQSFDTNDDYTTKYGMKGTITLQQVIVTSTQLVKVSAASWFTESSNRGDQNAVSPSDNVSALVQTGYFEGA